LEKRGENVHGWSWKREPSREETTTRREHKEIEFKTGKSLVGKGEGRRIV